MPRLGPTPDGAVAAASCGDRRGPARTEPDARRQADPRRGSDARAVPAHGIRRPSDSPSHRRRAPGQSRVRDPLAALAGRDRGQAWLGHRRAARRLRAAGERCAQGPRCERRDRGRRSFDALTRTPRQGYLRSCVGDPRPRPARHRRSSGRSSSFLEQLLRLLVASASPRGPQVGNASGLVNYSALARELALDDKTIKAHAELLTQLFLLHRLRPWSANLGARQVKTPKLLLTDTGLAATLVGVDAARYSAPDQGGMAGGLFETFVVMELIKQATWSAGPVEVFFYRDTEKREVDLVIESALRRRRSNRKLKSTVVATASDTRIAPLRDKLGQRFKSGIVYSGEQYRQAIDDRILGPTHLRAVAIAGGLSSVEPTLAPRVGAVQAGRAAAAERAPCCWRGRAPSSERNSVGRRRARRLWGVSTPRSSARAGLSSHGRGPASCARTRRRWSARRRPFEHPGKRLEDVGDTRCDFEGDGDIGRGGAGGERGGVVEEDLE